jgi:HTH-type transcriptional regulator / antitoxin HigA
MKPRVIKSDKEYQAALTKVESLMDAKAGTEAEAELELWALLVESYESTHYPIDSPDPIEAIRFRMEQQGLRPVDLTQFIKSKSHVSEVLSHKRPLTLSMIRALSSGLNISADVLVQEASKRIVKSSQKQAGKRLKRAIA